MTNQPQATPLSWLSVHRMLNSNGSLRAVGKLTAMLLAFAMVATMSGWTAPRAVADTAPADPSDPRTPVTVAADALPTVQIDGVVWQQAIIGNTVYAVGDFNTVRPAGSAPGTNTTARNNIVAYDIRTGRLIESFSPSLNAQATAITASPDGSRIYIGGEFTSIDGVQVWRVAALDASSGDVITSFRPQMSWTVDAIVATNNTVYLGGNFTAVGSVQRGRLAAVTAADGSLLDWDPVAANGRVRALELSPDGSQIVVGGSFTTLNGSSNPGYGLGAVDAITGELLPFAANGLIRNGGTDASILSLDSDGTNIYGTGYVFGAGGNLEGAFSANWSNGQIKWVADCHGDFYDVYASDTAVYSVGHAHYCGNIGGFPQTDPWTFHRGLAMSTEATGTITRDPYGYFNYEGNPAPSLLTWFPNLNLGTFTGQFQGPWTVTGNDRYVVMGGEFTQVNRNGQQGLVRFATSDIAPNDMGPERWGEDFTPSAVSLASGVVRVSWPANWDRDNGNLKYTVIRDGDEANPVYETQQESTFWQLPAMGFLDKGLEPGSSHQYRVIAEDPFGNQMRSPSVSVTVSSSGELSAYAGQVLNDGASNYWRLGEDSGSTAINWAGWSDMLLSGGFTRGADGAIIGDSNQATGFEGGPDGIFDNSTNGFGSTQQSSPGPDTFTTEAWFQTTTDEGGKILGFGGSSTSNSNSYDRHVYMGNDGRIWFGVYPGGVRTVSSSESFNDGQWHHVVASLGDSGMRLYIDGRRVAQRQDVTFGQSYSGYWRIGGDNLNGWPDNPTSDYFAGNIDDVAIYPTVLSRPQVQDHFRASGRTLDIQPAPSDAYGAAVYQSDPEFYWRLGESSGPVATDSGIGGHTGTYISGTTLGEEGALAGVADTAVRFDGTSGLLSSDDQFINPRSYTEELWFKTTTTNGGKLIGFGNNRTGLSTNYDRHVYMENDGRLTFGVWTGQTSIITSSDPYNDGTWHHLAAMQSSAGMKLFVDGQLVGENPQTAAQDYTGYWKVGGDTTWGPQPYFAGVIDEVAVYSRALTASEVEEHYVLGTTGQPVNESPVAAFGSSVSGLSVSVDGSGSSDPDGSVESYEWDFGDGSAAVSGAVAEHVYGAPGTYTVSLTVTDDGGATDVVTEEVTVAEEEPPAAGVLAQDGFARTVAEGLGTADFGGPWSLSRNSSFYAVDGAKAVFDLRNPGTGPSASLNSVSSTATDTSVKISLEKVADGGGTYFYVAGREVAGAGEYRAKVRVAADGDVALFITRLAGGSETSLEAMWVPGLSYAAGEQLQVRLQVTGTSPTTVRAKVWKVGEAEPGGWQVSSTDSTAALQAAGGIGLRAYVSGSATNTPVAAYFDDLLVTTPANEP